MVCNRIYEIDSIRGLAAICIVMRHFSIELGLKPLNGSYLAVDLFFILSGIVLCKVYENKIITKKIEFKEFILKRVIRLAPIHYFALFLFAILQGYFYFSNNLNAINKDFNLFSLTLNLLFMHNIGIINTLSINYPAWSISVELFVNIFWFYLILNKKNSTAIKVIIILISFLLLITLFGTNLNQHIKSMLLINSGILRCLIGFFIGTLIYRYYIIKNDSFNKISSKIINISSISIILCIFGSYYFYEKPFMVGVDYIISLILFPIFICLSLNKKSFLSYILRWKFLVYLGTISYSIYLLHLITLEILRKINKDFLHLELNYFLAVFLITILIISSLSYHLIEKKSEKILRNLIFKKKYIPLPEKVQS